MTSVLLRRPCAGRSVSSGAGSAPGAQEPTDGDFGSAERLSWPGPRDDRGSSRDNEGPAVARTVAPPAGAPRWGFHRLSPFSHRRAFPTVHRSTSSRRPISAWLKPSCWSSLALCAIRWYTGAASRSRTFISIGSEAAVRVLCDRVHHSRKPHAAVRRRSFLWPRECHPECHVSPRGRLDRSGRSGCDRRRRARAGRGRV